MLREWDLKKSTVALVPSSDGVKSGVVGEMQARFAASQGGWDFLGSLENGRYLASGGGADVGSVQEGSWDFSWHPRHWALLK